MQPGPRRQLICGMLVHVVRCYGERKLQTIWEIVHEKLEDVNLINNATVREDQGVPQSFSNFIYKR